MKYTFVILFFIYLTEVTFGSTRVTSVAIDKVNAQRARVEITFDNEFKGNPEIMVRSNLLQVSLEGAIVWPKINKKGSLNDKTDTTLMAYQYNRKKVRVRAILPYKLNNDSHTEVYLKGNKAEIFFPLQIAPLAKKKKKEFKMDSLNEEYLESLIVDNKKEKKKKVNEKTDEVKSQFSSQKKVGLDNINFKSYALKFGGFLFVIIAFFVAVVALLRKGVLNKGKLSFLKSDEMVSVLNTTYIGPKKSLLLVKVHNQILLLSNSEKGINFIREVDGMSNILKDGEKLISGENFDEKIEKVTEKDVDKVQLKKDITQSYSSQLDKFIKSENIKPRKKSYTDKVKSKLKELKPL